MSGVDVERLRKVAEAATPAPWRHAEQTHGEWTGIHDNFSALGSMTTGQDAYFVATARNEWDALLDHIAGEQARVDAAKAESWDEGKQAGENFESARWAGSGVLPRPALDVLNPYRAALRDATAGSADEEPCAEYGQHPRGGHQSARRAAEIRGRTSDCLPFCQGGLHEEGCAALRDATHTDTPEVTAHTFTEDVDDASMCVCGVPALTHDQVYPEDLR